MISNVTEFLEVTEQKYDFGTVIKFLKLHHHTYNVNQVTYDSWADHLTGNLL